MENLYTGGWKRYSGSRTKVQNIFLFFSLSDQVLKISGRVFTAQVGRLSDGSGDNFEPEGREITRYVILATRLWKEYI